VLFVEDLKEFLSLLGSIEFLLLFSIDSC
jgi:hypothetical protein